MARVTIEPAVPHVETAAELLRISWRRPCIHYTSSYLYWQFTYPSSRPSLAAVAREGNQLIGFAAMIPRQMRVAGQAMEINHISFVCVRPEHRREGLGTELYQALFQEVTATQLPFLAFTIVRSTSERTLKLGAEDAGFKLQSLGEYVVHGYLHRHGLPEHQADPSIRIVGFNADVADQARTLINMASDRPKVLGVDANHETMAHWQRDPRRAKTLLALRDDVCVGASMIVRGQISTHRGIDDVTSIERLFIPEGNPRVIESLIHSSGAYWASEGQPEFVSLSNLRAIPEDVVRSIGVRQTPTRFVGHLGIPPGFPSDLLNEIEMTNIAVT